MILLIILAIALLGVNIYLSYQVLNKRPEIIGSQNNYSKDFEMIHRVHESLSNNTRAMVHNHVEIQDSLIDLKDNIELVSKKEPTKCQFQKTECKGCDLSKLEKAIEKLHEDIITEDELRKINDDTTYFVEK